MYDSFKMDSYSLREDPNSQVGVKYFGLFKFLGTLIPSIIDLYTFRKIIQLKHVKSHGRCSVT